MKRTLLALLVLAFVTPAWQSAKAGVEVNFDFFYNNMSGGSWIEVADYGYCWQPEVAVSNTRWRPYADGYWAYTDLGWTWVSYEDFGWATYHYGRWVRLADEGWVWAPGRDRDLEWGPAWVSWRTGGDYVGWAPLTPEVSFYDGRRLTGAIDVEFDIGPGYYNFVDVRYIGEPVLRERIFEPSQNVTYIQQTVNVTNITYQNNAVYNYGPDINVINTRATRPIQRLKIERQDNVDPTVAARSGAITKVQGDKLVVAAPMRIQKPGQLAPPPKIKARVTQAKIDKGWSVVGDPNAQAQLKQKLKTQDAKNVAPLTGAGAAGQAAVGASPGGANAVAGASVSPAGSASPAASAAAATTMPGGKGKDRDRAGAQINAGANANANAATSPAGAASPGESASPGAKAAVSSGQPANAFGRGKGKNNKNRPAEQLNDAAGGSPAGAAAVGASPAAADAAATTNTGAGLGRGKGKARRLQDTPADVNASGAAAVQGSTPEAMTGPQGTGAAETGVVKRKGRNFEQGAGAQIQGQTGTTATEPGPAKTGRRFEQQSAAAAGAGAGAEGQGAQIQGQTGTTATEEGPVKKGHRFEQQGVPAAGAGVGAEVQGQGGLKHRDVNAAAQVEGQGQVQGKAGGKKSQPPETSPVPSPQ